MQGRFDAASVVRLDGRPVGRAVVGGKGALLSRLAALGAPVPSAVALTTDAYRRMAAGSGVPVGTTTVQASDLPAIREAIRRWELPTDLRDELVAGYRGLAATAGGEIPLAVRSSATTEDAASTSFAGLHETVLGVRGHDALERAVKRCWSSLWTARALAYRQQWARPKEDAAMAVVIQHLVRTDVAFVAFTADPATGREDRLVIDATWGLGEALVAGMVTPDHVVVGPDGKATDYVIGEKATMVIPAASGTGTRRVAVPRGLRDRPALTPHAVQEIAAAARSLAEGLGFAADIEGGLADGHLYVFQARPITNLSTRSWNGDGTRDQT
jgi:phosphoenolpyruvate synthase/pyruvate phosphate dikinase